MSYANKLSSMVNELMILKIVPDVARSMKRSKQAVYQWRTRPLKDDEAYVKLLLMKATLERMRSGPDSERVVPAIKVAKSLTMVYNLLRPEPSSEPAVLPQEARLPTQEVAS